MEGPQPGTEGDRPGKGAADTLPGGHWQGRVAVHAISPGVVYRAGKFGERAGVLAGRAAGNLASRGHLEFGPGPPSA